MEQTLVEVITTLGFPTACVVACGYFINKTQQQSREDNNKREERMFEQLDKFGDSMDAFNNTLIAIDGRLQVVEDAIKSNKE